MSRRAPASSRCNETPFPSVIAWSMRIDDAMRLLLAHAVMKPGSRVMMIDEMNKRFGPLISIERAIRTSLKDGYTYAVVVADEVIAIDSDSALQWEAEDGTPGPLQAWLHAAFEEVEPVVVESGRHGHHHVFVRIEDTETRERFIRLADELGLERRYGGARIRPPGAPHRRGLEVQLVDIAPEEALRRLQPSTPRQTSRRGRSAHVDRLLTRGAEGRWPHPDGRGADRSQLLRSALWSAIQTGADRLDLFARLRNPDGLHWEATRLICFRDGTVRDEINAREEFDAAWADAEEDVREHPARSTRGPSAEARIKVQAEVDRLYSIARATIRGRTADTDLQLFRTFCKKAIRLGDLDVEYSRRALVEDSFCSPQAASDGIVRLSGSGLLLPISVGAGEEGSVYRLQIPSHLKDCPLVVSTRETGGVSDLAGSVEGHLLFSRRRGEHTKAKGLGPAAGRLLAALTRAGKPVALREVVADGEARLSRSMAYRALEALKAWQLVIDENGMLSAPPDVKARMERAVDEIGLPEAQAKRRQQHETERDRYREELDQIASGQRPSAVERKLLRSAKLLSERPEFVARRWGENRQLGEGGVAADELEVLVAPPAPTADAPTSNPTGAGSSLSGVGSLAGEGRGPDDA